MNASVDDFKLEKGMHLRASSFFEYMLSLCLGRW